MATQTIEQNGYVVVKTERGFQYLKGVGVVDSPGMEAFLVRRIPGPEDCQLETGLMTRRCHRPDGDCDLCKAQVEADRNARAEAHRTEVEEEKKDLASLPALPDGQVRVWRTLVSLCGCSGIAIGEVRGRSIYVKIYPEDRHAFRIDKAKYDAGERQFRGSWCLEKFNPEAQAAEAVQDKHWQD